MAAAAAASRQKSLRIAIQTGSFDPVYYFHGTEEYLKDEAVRHLVAGAVDPSTRDFNFEVRRGAELDAETLGSILATPPMMADGRVLVVRDVLALRKDARVALEQYLARPAADVVLVLLSPAGAKEDRVLLTRCTAIDFEALSGARVPKWIAHYAEHEHNCEISADAARLLEDAVGTELLQLKAELDKLASYVSTEGDGTIIDEAAVAAVVGVRRGETLADLLDAVARRDCGAALGLIPHVLQQAKTSAVTVILALTTQTLALAWGRTRRERGASASRLENDFYGLLKEAGSTYTGRSWGDAVRSWSRHVDRWTGEQLDAGLEALLAADAALKETRLSTDEQLLGTLVLSMCASA